MGFYEQKYLDGSVFLVLKSLAYYTNADEDIMPKMFDDTSWVKIKEFISKELKNYV